MNFISVFFIAVGLSMDAFAVAVTNGLFLKKLKPWYAIKFGLFFGGFQFLMPVIGYFLGQTFNQHIMAYDHWIAFGLLSIIGGKMLYESRKADCEVNKKSDEEIISNSNLTLLAIATSIDAMAVGVSFAFVGGEILNSAIVIGVVAFVFSALGVMLGKRLGSVFKSHAERFGGFILVGIGFKILFEHLGILG